MSSDDKNPFSIKSAFGTAFDDSGFDPADFREEVETQIDVCTYRGALDGCHAADCPVHDREVDEDEWKDRIALRVVTSGEQFERALNELSMTCYHVSQAQGFWNDDPRVMLGDLYSPDEHKDRMISPSEMDSLELHYKATKLALIASETTEALEAIRKGVDTSEHGFDAEAEEIADIIIRCLDYSGRYIENIGEIVQRKILFNIQRKKKHGKKF